MNLRLVWTQIISKQGFGKKNLKETKSDEYEWNA